MSSSATLTVLLILLSSHITSTRAAGSNETTLTPDNTTTNTATDPTVLSNNTTAAPNTTAMTTASNGDNTTAAPNATAMTTASNAGNTTDATAMTTASNADNTTAAPDATAMTTNATNNTTAAPNATTTTSTAQTTSQLITVIYVRLHITNLAYSSILNDPTSTFFMDLEAKIALLFNETYGCSTCTTQATYLGMRILTFSSGSVIADTQASFKGPESSDNVQTLLTKRLSDNNNQFQNLQISGIQASTVQFSFGSDAAAVPGWGIALLVLASILVLLCIIFIIVMIVLLCRRKHSGHMDVFASRGSYHSMNDYTAYQTHGRYVPPHTYETAGNGTKNKYSYTNPGLETKNL